MYMKRMKVTLPAACFCQAIVRTPAVSPEKIADPSYRFCKVVTVGQKYDAKMIRCRPVETAALHQQHPFFQQEIQHKLLVILDG